MIEPFYPGNERGTRWAKAYYSERTDQPWGWHCPTCHHENERAEEAAEILRQHGFDPMTDLSKTPAAAALFTRTAPTPPETGDRHVDAAA